MAILILIMVIGRNCPIPRTPTAEPMILALDPIRKFRSSAFAANHSRIIQTDLFPENFLGKSNGRSCKNVIVLHKIPVEITSTNSCLVTPLAGLHKATAKSNCSIVVRIILWHICSCSKKKNRREIKVTRIKW